MAISRILGASLVSDLDRQGVDLQFTTSGNTLVYMDFVDFRLGVNETNPSEALHVNGNVLVGSGNVLTSANLVYNLGSETNWWNTLYIGNIVAGSFSAGNVDGTLSTNSQPNITSLGTLTGLAIDGNLSVNVAIVPFANGAGTIGTESLTWNSLYVNTLNASSIYGTILTADQPNITNLGNITVDSISIGGNITITGNTSGGVINADELYEANNRVLTSNTIFTITGDVVGSGDYTNIAVTLSNTGVTAGVYGSADDEFADRIPKITVDSQGRITNIANVTLTQVGNVNFNDTTISANADVTISSTGNIYLDAQGTGIVRISSTTAIGLPNGDSSNRPDYPEVGYFRYNSDIIGIEYWDGNAWISPGVQPISSQVLVPDGITDDFILSDVATPESVLVMINGTLQQPYTAYNVTGNVITFSEVPLTSDAIEVRRIATGATTVAGLALGPTTVGLTVGNVNIAGNLIPQANVTYDIGSNDRQWRDLFLSGNTIHLGGATLSTNGSTLEFTPAGGSTAIDLSGDTDPASISSGASNVRVTANYVNVAISSTNIASFSSTGIATTGNISAAYIIGDGSQLTGLPAGYTDTNVAGYLPSYTGTLGGNLAVDNLTGVLAISKGGTGSTSTSGALNNLLPSGEVSGYVLKTSGPGSYYWAEGSGGGGATVGSQITTSRTFFTANSGQTEFTGVGTYTIGSGQLRVYINGVRQFDDAYTETSNSSFTLSTGVTSGVVVLAEVDAYQDYTVYASDVVFANLGGVSATNVQDAIAELDTEKASLGGADFTGNVSTSGNLRVTDTTESTGEGTGALVVSGGASFGGNVYISGNLQVAGTETIFNANNLNIADSLIYLADDNPGDVLDIGIVSAFTNPGYQHTGFARDATDGTWKLFANVVAEPTTTIDFTNATYSNLRIGNLSSVNATLTGNLGVASVNATNLYGTVQTAAQTNITSVGTLTGLTVSTAPVPVSNVTVNLGSTSAWWNIFYANTHVGATATFTGDITAANFNGTLLTASQPNITSVGTLGTLNVSGLTTLAETTEILDTKSNVTGTVVHDFSTSAIWYYSSMSGNVTANITNVPTTDNRVTSISIVVNQGVTGYIINGLQINGSAQTIRWQGNTVPTASTNRLDVFTFSLLRAASTWTVLGSVTSHG